jgi:hypothetical protein
MRRAVIVTTLVATLAAPPAFGAAQAPSAGASTPSAGGPNAQGAAMDDFQKRLQAYLDLREALSQKVKPLSPTPDAAELTARQESLAVAMKSARAGAKPGDLVPEPVARQIAAIVTADRKRRQPVAKKAALEEVPGLPSPAINRTYPPDAALPTVPPLLLAQLPKLPDNLQYRFYGRHVVILDGDLQIITDYVANVLPPH